MFTGLIEELGTVSRVERVGADARLIISASYDDLVLGESVAVEGACLTVDAIVDDGFAATASAETLTRTTLGTIRPGRRVHLERALAVGGRLGGHIVTGHVDAVGRMKERSPQGKTLRVGYELPKELEPFVAEKGSIAIDGVSLTVNGVEGGAFWVMLVPFTRAETHLDQTQPGATVNLETDVLAKYVDRLLRFGKENLETTAEGRNLGHGGEGAGLTEALLLKQGFYR